MSVKDVFKSIVSLPGIADLGTIAASLLPAQLIKVDSEWTGARDLRIYDFAKPAVKGLSGNELLLEY